MQGGPDYGRGSSRRFLNYNGSPLLANDSVRELRGHGPAGAERSPAAGSRGTSVGELLVHDGGDQESSPPKDDASLAPPPSQQHEVESKLSMAASERRGSEQDQPYKDAGPRLARMHSDAGRSVGQTSQKTKGSSNSGSGPSLKEPGAKRAMEQYAKDRFAKSDIKENILAMEDFEEVYRNNVKQMKGFNRDRMAMISRNLQDHKMNAADLEEMLEKIKVAPVIKRHNSLALQKIMLPNVKREMEDALNEQDVRCGQAYHYATTPKPSSASKALNVMRNQQTSDIINLVCKNEFNRLRQRQIQECIRAFNIEQRHIVELKKAFTACELNSRSETTLKELLESIHERGLRYPPLILNFFLNVLNVNDMFDDNTPPAGFVQEVAANHRGFNGQDRLAFKKLQSLEWIYNHCPMLTSYFYNNSDNFKNAISMNAFADVDS